MYVKRQEINNVKCLLKLATRNLFLLYVTTVFLAFFFAL